ncbi:MAG: double-strand break repair helicase AddA [Alphaproteobacteria bacterium]
MSVTSQIFDRMDPDTLQRRAARPVDHVWVAASAGSGKTKVLTDRVLRLLLDRARPETILCITFTKAAAAEMANRINTALGEWTTLPDAKLGDRLQHLLGMPPTPEQLAYARILFAKVLDAPGGLKIQTVHAFCQSVLGRFSLEASVAPHFQVMDERQAGDLMRQARDRVLNRAADDDTLSAASRTIGRYGTEEAFDDLIRNLTGNQAQLRRLLDRHGSVDAVIAALYGTLRADPDSDADLLQQQACRDDAFDRDGLTALVEAMRTASNAKTDSKHAGLVTTWLAATTDEREAGFSAYQSVFLTGDGAPRKTVATKAVLEANPALTAVIDAEQTRLIALDEAVRRQVSADASAALLRLGLAMLAAYELAKAHRALLDYDDLIIKTRDLLTDSVKASAWVMFKLDGGLSHILVDEAQDTAPEQWELILALASEFFAGEGQADIARSLFVVGDVKQSIYSFQRADPAVFQAVRKVIADWSADANNPMREIPFRFSFRSAPAVLAAVDATFAASPARDGVLEDGEEKLVHRSMRDNAAGRVEVWPLVEPPTDDDFDPWEAQTKPVETLPALERLADGIAGRVADMIGRDTLPSRDNRPTGPGDIMVLVRRRGPLVDALIRRLKQRGVPVAGVDRLVLGEQIAVMDLLALGHFLLLPEDDLTCATILKSPFIGFDDNDLFDLAYDRGKESIWTRLRARANDSNRYATAVAWLSDLLAQVDYLRPYEFFTGILDSICPAQSSAGSMTGRQALDYRLGTEVEEPVEEFLAQALLYERANLPVLQGFLHWFSTGTAEIKRDLDTASGQSVRILTVHGAKGLQAPIIILPDAPSKPRADQGPALHWLSGPRQGPSATAPEAMIWTPSRRYEEPVAQTLRMEAGRRDDEEYRRLLYVAMTRAEDRLIVCGHLGKRARPTDCWYDLVREGLAESDAVETLPFTGGPDWTGDMLVLADKEPDITKTESDRSPVEEETAAPALPDWAGTPAPSEPLPPNPLVPSRPTTPDPPVLSPITGTESGADRFQRGRVVHLLLQHLPGLPRDRRRDIGLTLIGHNRFAGLDETSAAMLVDEALAVLDHPDFAPLFGPGSRAEIPLTGLVDGPDGVQVVSGQVDRILVTDQEVLVVDYKTQRPAPDRAEDAPAAYLNQMAAYRAVLAGVFPGRPVRCALLWTDGPHLTPIDASLLERYRPATQMKGSSK